jgi:hypothetical protein
MFEIMVASCLYDKGLLVTGEPLSCDYLEGSDEEDENDDEDEDEEEEEEDDDENGYQIVGKNGLGSEEDDENEDADDDEEEDAEGICGLKIEITLHVHWESKLYFRKYIWKVLKSRPE